MTKLNCPFCDAGERVIKSNAHANVILSNPHKVAGHFLVVPERHVEQPWDLTKDELADIFELIFFIEQKIIGKLGEGADIRQNYRPFLAQSQLKVNHIHFHVYPRSNEDYLYQVAEKYETDLFTELDDDEATEVTKLLED